MINERIQFNTFNVEGTAAKTEFRERLVLAHQTLNRLIIRLYIDLLLFIIIFFF